jgi:hypothetical protein
VWMGWTIALGPPYLEFIDPARGPPMFRTLCSHCFRALLVCNGHNESAPAIPSRGGDDLWEAQAQARAAPQSATRPDPVRGRRKGKATRRDLLH